MSKQLITGLEQGEAAKYVFLCGEPERVPKIAAMTSNPKKIKQVREYTIYGGSLDDVPVTIASTGIGGPSTAILLEELANLGSDTFVRIGTSGGIADGLEKGDFVIATGAVKADGTTRSYTWPEYPALASYEVVIALIDSAHRLGAKFDAGICLSVDGFYSENKVLKEGRIAPMSQSGYITSFMVDKLSDAKKMGVRNIEMENGTIFTLAALLGLRAGAICTIADVVPWRPTEKMLDFERNMTDCIKIGIEGMRTLMAWDKRKRGGRFWCPSLK